MATRGVAFPFSILSPTVATDLVTYYSLLNDRAPRPFRVLRGVSCSVSVIYNIKQCFVRPYAGTVY